MVDPSARLLRLLSLLQSQRDWTSTELAGRLHVTARTIRHDVARLRDLGYPVDARPGVAGGYRLGRGAALPPLLLDDEEAVAVAVGLRTAASGSVAGIEETSVRALAKLQQILPSRLRHRVSAFGSYALPVPTRGPQVDPDVLTVVALACRDHEQLRFDYRNHSGGSSRRRVEPHRLVNDQRRWYLLAWDLERDDWRTFRVDRVEPEGSPPARCHRTRRSPPGCSAGSARRPGATGPGWSCTRQPTTCAHGCRSPSRWCPSATTGACSNPVRTTRRCSPSIWACWARTSRSSTRRRWSTRWWR
jgi:biotin operon repressor